MVRPMRYRRRADEILAIQVTPFSVADIAKWCGGRVVYDADKKVTGLVVPTLEGNAVGSLGDWVGRDADGTFFQYNQAAFDEDYVRA